MASGSFPVYSSNGYIVATCYWSSTPNTAGNYSDVNMELRASRTNSYDTWGTGAWGININGSVITGNTNVTISLNSNTLCCSRYNFRVDHNPDGSKSCYISAYFTISGVLTLGETGANVALDTIPRASAPTLSDGGWRIMRDQTFTIYTNRASTSFTHKIYYWFGNTGWVLINGNVGASCTWTPSISLASQMPGGTSGSGTIRCETYNGGTLIGTKDVAMGLTIPSDIIPSVSAAISDAMGYESFFGAYVATKSKYQVTLTDAGVYGSTIASRNIAMNGATYTSSPATSNTITSETNNSIVSTVTDTRGRSKSVTVTKTVLAYSPPKINIFSVSRCNADGTANEDGECAKISWNVEITPLNNKNTKSLKLKYKKTIESTYTEQNITMPSYAASGSFVVTGIDPLKTYEFQLVANDYFNIPIQSTKSLSTAFTIQDFSAGGTGMGIGKIAEQENLLDIALPTKLGGEIISTDSLNLYLLNRLYPIGAYYFSHVSTSPATLFGGTWVQVTSRFLYASTSAGTTGGASTQSFELTNAYAMIGRQSSPAMYLTWKNSTKSFTADRKFDTSMNVSGSSVASIDATALGGTTDSASIMPPYQTVYCWRRTA